MVLHVIMLMVYVGVHLGGLEPHVLIHVTLVPMDLVVYRAVIVNVIIQMAVTMLMVLVHVYLDMTGKDVIVSAQLVNGEFHVKRIVTVSKTLHAHRRTEHVNVLQGLLGLAVNLLAVLVSMVGIAQ